MSYSKADKRFKNLRLPLKVTEALRPRLVKTEF